MKRRELITLLSIAAAWPQALLAQQAALKQQITAALSKTTTKKP